MTDEVELYDSLDGQTAFVTGASRGIGRQIALDLLGFDAEVYGGVRDTTTLEDTNVAAVELDVTDKNTVRRAASQLSELDILVNNAGMHGPSGRFGETELGEVRETIETNLLGAMTVTRHFLRLLDDGSRVVNVSSGAGQLTDGVGSSYLPYAISKTGLNSFTNGLSQQYTGMYINAVCPGWVRTDMGGSEAERSVEKGAETPVWLARFREGPSGYFWNDKELLEW